MPTRTVGFIFPATGQNGPNNPNSADFTNRDWSNPGNITASAGVANVRESGTITCGVSACSRDFTAKYLQSRAYDFSSLPANKTVLGIEVRFEYTAISRIGMIEGILIEINHVRLLRSDALSGTAKDPGVSFSTTSATSENNTITSGGASDLWGSGITNTDDIKSDSGFGFGTTAYLRVTGTDESTDSYDVEIQIHSHEMKIYYDAGGQVKVWTGSSFDLKDVKYYNGSAFVDTSEVKRYNGSSFETVD